MNKFLHGANDGAFFRGFLPRIICSRFVISAMGLALERFFFVRSLGGARERESRAFADYLVSDRSENKFAKERRWHEYMPLPGCVTGLYISGWWQGIDAPEYLAAGAMRCGEFGPFSVCVRRDGFGDFGFAAGRWSVEAHRGVLASVFSEGRGEYIQDVDVHTSTNEGQVFGLGLHGWGWHSGALDAPELLAAGSCLSLGDGGAGIGAVVIRGAGE